MEVTKPSTANLETECSTANLETENRYVRTVTLYLDVNEEADKRECFRLSMEK